MAVLELTAPTNFFHLVDVRRYDVHNIDPRRPEFDWDAVTIDLSRCERIHPPAALWCMVYALLVADSGVDCDVCLPSSVKRRRFASGLDERDLLSLFEIMGDPSTFVLPVTPFNSITEAEDLEAFIIEEMERRNLGSSNVYVDVAVAFAELANNAVEHAQSPIDAYGYVWMYEDISGRDTVVVSVADGGMGIKASLQRNPEHFENALTDCDAIEYAMQENISGTQDHLRGIGLHHITNDILPPNRDISIHSGVGFVTVAGKEGGATEIVRNTEKRLFPGTLAILVAPI